MKSKIDIYILFVLLSFLTLASCKDKDNKDSDDDSPEIAEAKHTNEWILGQMKTYYYWNSNLPKSPDLTISDTESFFKSLLYEMGKRDGDRFSTIEEDYSNNNKSAVSNQLGFDFIIEQYFTGYEKDGESASVGFFVVNVRKGSDAESKGLKRGNIIYAINGTNISYGNYSDLYKYVQELSDIKLSVYNKEGEKVTLETIYSTNSYDSENPIWISEEVTRGSTRVGYIVYNKFEKGKVDDEDSYIYDEQLVQKIGNFYSNGIRNIVIDLRYNPGGYVTSAVNLASALVPNRSTKNVFAVSEYNATYQKALIAKYGREKALNDYFADRVGNTSTAIPKTNFDKVYILATENSASASELTIAGLRPYLGSKLKHIGTTTVGKDKGSYTLESDDDKIKWILHPLVSRLENSDGTIKNYINGLGPNKKVEELFEGFEKQRATNATSGAIVYLPKIYPWKGGWYDLGDPREPLLAAAFDDIEEITTVKSAESQSTTTLSASIPPINKMRNEVMWKTKPELEEQNK